MALVIGVSAYEHEGILKNAVNDADDVSSKLKQYGFDVIKITDCGSREMHKTLDIFEKKLKEYKVGLFYFAGHAFQEKGKNFLGGKDLEMTGNGAAKFTSLSLDDVIEIMDISNVSTKIIMLDSCRNEIVSTSSTRGGSTTGLASVFAPKGTIIGFATSPGEKAFDGGDRNGRYTEAILTHIDEQDITIESMFKKVRNTVAANTAGNQTTWEHTSLLGEFYFNFGLHGSENEYSQEAYSDFDFMSKDESMAQDVIEELKSADWYRQNPAIKRLNWESINNISKNDLFVIGRNIYQAACGSSGAAIDFIDNFIHTTIDWENAKVNNILDGMLFEIYFDNSGKLRQSFKSSVFEEVFKLRRKESLVASFDFISKCLIGAGSKIKVLPAKKNEIELTLNLDVQDDEYVLTGIYHNGDNILRVDEPYLFHEKSKDQFERKLASKLTVLKHQLKINYNSTKDFDVLKIPLNWDVL